MARSSKSSGNGLTLLGVLSGAAIGAAVALVNSPHKGETNRKHLLEWGQARLNQAKDKAQQTLNRRGR